MVTQSQKKFADNYVSQSTYTSSTSTYSPNGSRQSYNAFNRYGHIYTPKQPPQPQQPQIPQPIPLPSFNSSSSYEDDLQRATANSLVDNYAHPWQLPPSLHPPPPSSYFPYSHLIHHLHLHQVLLLLLHLDIIIDHHLLHNHLFLDQLIIMVIIHHHPLHNMEM